MTSFFQSDVGFNSLEFTLLSGIEVQLSPSQHGQYTDRSGSGVARKPNMSSD